MNSFEEEVGKGERFEFGKNWQDFLLTLNDRRIKEAENSIKELLRCESLKGKKFLDVGSGSGLFSLVARRLGASVLSFDYDPSSVACAQELRSRYFPNDEDWKIEQASVLDDDFLNTVGTFDIVYSWGVLHHTGNMQKALENVAKLVQNNGILVIAIYNDQGKKSRRWWKIKKLYCSSALGRLFVSSIFVPYFFLRIPVVRLIKGSDLSSSFETSRGMSIVHDWFDWLGGFPFEVAKVEDIFRFYDARGFRLRDLKTTIYSGNNEYVFVRG